MVGRCLGGEVYPTRRAASAGAKAGAACSSSQANTLGRTAPSRLRRIKQPSGSTATIWKSGAQLPLNRFLTSTGVPAVMIRERSIGLRPFRQAYALVRAHGPCESLAAHRPSTPCHCHEGHAHSDDLQHEERDREHQTIISP